MRGRTLWLRWIGANALGELLGLGLTFWMTALAISRLEHLSGTVGILAAFGAAVLSGIIEATIVGLAQWWAMHPWFPKITRTAWWLATLAGALIAYVLGYLPSTLISLGEEVSASPAMAEPPQWLTLLLAAGLGAVAGAVLSFAQWFVLRRTVRRASWWIPANMLAWLAGMPLIFWGFDRVWVIGLNLVGILVLAGVFLLAGAVVGGIHGIFLVRMTEETVR